jgi:hypothetical protein
MVLNALGDVYLTTCVGHCARGFAFKGVDQMSQAMYRNVATAIKVGRCSLTLSNPR